MALLVLDTNIAPRVTTELKARGRNAISLQELRMKQAKDDDMLRFLHETFEPSLYVLITGDDRMPLAHAPTVRELGVTIATIDPRRVAPYDAIESASCWPREVIHRWAHIMAEQGPGSVFRYGYQRRRPWTPTTKGQTIRVKRAA